MISEEYPIHYCASDFINVQIFMHRKVFADWWQNSSGHSIFFFEYVHKYKFIK